MIQGQSLKACFTDVVHTELTEEPSEELQISGYVMLSRACYPELLWILRAFSSKLFSQGSPSGPSILLRKLCEDISPEQAQLEMDASQAAKKEKEAESKARKKKEQLYCCTYCMLSKKEDYMKPSHAFGARTTEEVIEMIMRFGAWTQCLKCQKTLGKPIARAADRMQRITLKGIEQRQCQECDAFQPSTYFRQGQDCCIACQHITCAACERLLHPSCYSRSSRNNHFNVGKNVRCEECKIDKKDGVDRRKTNTCRTCNDVKPLLCFRLYQKSRKDICMDCERIGCAACHTSKPNEAFEPSIVNSYWKGNQKTVVCITCKAYGATGKDPNLYSCTSYCASRLGSTHFDQTTLRNFKHHSRKTLVCKGCLKLEKKKYDEITKKMKLKAVWRCTCGYKLNHGEKCQLFPKDRWPGGPLVSQDDYKWWVAHEHYRKS